MTFDAAEESFNTTFLKKCKIIFSLKLRGAVLKNLTQLWHKILLVYYPSLDKSFWLYLVTLVKNFQNEKLKILKIVRLERNFKSLQFFHLF